MPGLGVDQVCDEQIVSWLPAVWALLDCHDVTPSAAWAAHGHGHDASTTTDAHLSFPAPAGQRSHYETLIWLPGRSAKLSP
jgi:hypothetical protein